MRIRDISGGFLIQIGAIAITSFLVIGTIFMLIYGSFWSTRPGSIGFFTLDNYLEILQAPWFFTVAQDSILISVLAVSIACAIGVPMAWIVSRTNVPFARHLDQMSIFPFLVSPYTLAIAWALLGDPRIGFINTLGRLVFPSIDHFINIYTPLGIAFVSGLYYCPYIFMLTSGALKSMDPALEEVSKCCGAGTLQTAVRITIPLVSPAIIAAVILVFVMSLEMFAIPIVLGYPFGIFTFTTRIYMFFKWPPPQYGVGAALGFLLLAVCGVLIFAYRRYSLKKPYITVTGKGFRPGVIDLGVWRYPAFAFCSLYFVILLVVPYTLLIVTSFQSFTGRFDAWTLNNYHTVFNYPLFWRALSNSVAISIFSATACILLAIIISWIANRTKNRGRGIPEYVASSPVAIPGIVMAAGVLWLFLGVPALTPVYGTIFIIVIAYITRYTAYGVRTVSSTMLQIHPELEEAARISGSSWLSALRRITLPLLKPGIMSAFIFVLVLTFRELSMSSLLWTSQTITLPVLINEIWTEGRWGWLTAMSMIQTLVIFLIVVSAQKLLGVRVKMGER